MIEEESIKLHQKYRRWLRYSIISIWLAAGLFWLISNWWERWEANQRSKFDKANLLWLVKNPNTLDFYEFQTFSQPSSGRKLVDYGRPIAKIFQVQGNKVGFIFSQKNLPSRPGSNIFFNTLFDDKNKRIDTVFLEQEEILKTLANDTVQVNLRDTSFFIIELLNISRINGPFFQPYMMQADKISLVNTRLQGTVVTIENIKGTADCTQVLPFTVGEIENTRLDFKIKSKNGEAEFLIKGTSPLSHQWVNRILVKSDKVWTVQE